MDLNDSRLSRKINRGPDRVVILDDGSAVPQHRALLIHGVQADIVFVRNDGWTLGAPRKLEGVAYRMWEDQWVGYYRTGSANIRPISDYPANIDERRM